MDGKPGGPANQMLDPTFKSTVFMVWLLLSKRITIENFLLLKVFNCHQGIPHGTLFLCMYIAVKADDGVEIINSGKDVAVGNVGPMVFFILSPHLSNCVVNVEAGKV